MNDNKLTAKDLMIGDWVQGHLPDTYSQITGIPNHYRVSVRMKTLSGGVCTECPIDDIRPIPLTSEILVKNEFENDFHEDESVADYVKVRLEGYSLRCKADGWDDALVTWCNGHLEVVTDFNGEVRKDIDHVHQLQHCLKLVGIDKEIVL